MIQLPGRVLAGDAAPCGGGAIRTASSEVTGVADPVCFLREMGAWTRMPMRVRPESQCTGVTGVFSMDSQLWSRAVLGEADTMNGPVVEPSFFGRVWTDYIQ